ncbi:MAG: superoxide dismutase family protein [Paracoccus sp. (in: a-proteobacteria)]|nr:superoxide dismutase family protein [Paracoccus sp. (in: a-proteobacteria)]
MSKIRNNPRNHAISKTQSRTSAARALIWAGASIIAFAGLTTSVAFGQDGGSMQAQIAGPDGNALGEVTVRDTASGQAHVMIALSGLPEGTLGIHIHETGACTPDFDAAGGHLAGEAEHGIDNEGGPHPGDMPNLHVPESGEITVEYFLAHLSTEMMDGENGAALIIHEHADDYHSQPTGEAGGRIGCGVFERQ